MVPDGLRWVLRGNIIGIGELDRTGVAKSGVRVRDVKPGIGYVQPTVVRARLGVVDGDVLLIVEEGVIDIALLVDIRRGYCGLPPRRPGRGGVAGVETRGLGRGG